MMVRFIVFLDVETTGTDPSKDEIIQISAIKFLGTQEIERFDTYVNPGCPIPFEATSVNGITDKAFALGCGYRKILSSGRIFYGNNRNI